MTRRNPGLAALVVCCTLAIAAACTPDNDAQPSQVPLVVSTSRPTAAITPADPSVDVYYQNCDEVRRAGQAPLHRGDPGYRSGLDRDDDGLACE